MARRRKLPGHFCLQTMERSGEARRLEHFRIKCLHLLNWGAAMLRPYNGFRDSSAYTRTENALVAEEGGAENEIEDGIGEKAEEDGADASDGQDHVYRYGEAGGRFGGDFRAGFAHVHEHDDAQVVVGADDAVDGHEHGEPDEMRVDGGFEDIELAEEAGGDGQAEQREKIEAEGGGDEGLALRETGVVIDRKIFFAHAAELRHDREGANLHQRVAQQVKENRGIGC